MWLWDQRFEDSIQEHRHRMGMATLGVEERDAFFTMMRWMLKLKPNDRPTAKQVLETDWMRYWVLPDCEKITE